MNTTDQNERPPASEGYPASISDFLRVSSRYRNALLLANLLAALTILLGAVLYLLVAGFHRSTSIAFRLEFRGADRGEFPNGTPFSPSEIVSTPTLVEVYTNNSLAEDLDYQTFRNSIFVVESNPALDALQREYRAKLSDPKLSSIDRDRLEQEFESKKTSIARSDYMISFFESARVKAIPHERRVKILSDILSTWAEQTVQVKGVVLYDLPILSSGIFDRKVLDAYDYVIALDIVRAKIVRIIRNIDELSTIPGADVVRTKGRTGASLAELRVRLEDSVKFRIEPLVGMTLQKGLSKNPTTSIAFLKTRLTFNEIERVEAESRVDTIRHSLDTYDQFENSNAPSGQPPRPNETVVPQIDSTFLDRLVTLTSANNDLEFRQSLVNDMQAEAMKVVPLRGEEQYYKALIESLQGFEGRARDAQPEELMELNRQVTAVIEEVVVATDQMNEIYGTVSANLNPSTVMYSVTEPAVTTSMSRVDIPRLVLISAVLLVLAFVFSLGASVLHARLTSRTQEAPR